MVLESMHDSNLLAQWNVARSGMDILVVGFVSRSFHSDFSESGKTEKKV